VKRKYSWLLPVAVAVGLATYSFVWPWYRDRPARAAADALIGELDDHGASVEQRAAALPPVPENPTKAELGRLAGQVAAELGEASGRSRELSEREKEVLPRTPAGKRDELREALVRYTGRVGQAFAKYKERGDQLRERVAALKGGG
jgi:hypothetical protein